jgi:hypothetical protein
LVVHFAGQFGGARASDGKLPPGMLVQYLRLLAHYHGAFLDRLAALEASQAVAQPPPGAGARRPKAAFHPFHDDAHAQLHHLRAGGAGGAKPLNARVFGGGRQAASGGKAATAGPKV